MLLWGALVCGLKEVMAWHGSSCPSTSPPSTLKAHCSTFPRPSSLLFRALAIIALLKDEPRLAAERAAHAKKRGAYQGYGSYDVQAQGGEQQQQQGQGQWQAAAGDGGHLSAEGRGEAGQQSGSPEYRERGPMDGGGLRAAGETKGVR